MRASSVHLIGRIYQAIGGSVGAYAAAAFYGVDSLKDQADKSVGGDVVILAFVTIVLTIIVFPITWKLKKRALDLSYYLVLEAIKVVEKSTVPGPDGQVVSLDFDRCYDDALQAVKANGSFLERRAASEIQDALRERASALEHVPITPNPPRKKVSSAKLGRCKVEQIYKLRHLQPES